MTLSELKTFMIERKQASLIEIGIHFASPTSAVRPMLEQWIAKGRLRRISFEGGCGKSGAGCSCKEKPAEVFEWIN